ncbi:MAG: serine/threonine protein kinase [Rhodocyclales bacterium GWA2_65_20]|nr:MAG: serine/threonine protein kinase [Rhodocyclales bacterium GWA2_65_20]
MPPPVCQPLPQGFRIDKYRIERQLSVGGFSIVYLAYDEAGTRVAIKEYLPSQLAQRSGTSPVPVVPAEQRAAFVHGMKSFYEEARLLAHIRHPNIVEVLNFIKANETAYMVMRYESGQTLLDYLRGLKESGATIKEDFLRDVFVRLLSGLREVHRQKLLHLDLKPANIYLRDDSHPVLLDFGATRLGLGEGDPSLGHMFTPGFAAPELRGSREALGPWTDIYSIGATLYACLAGYAPQPAELRLTADELVPAQQRWSKTYSLQLLELIDWCLKLAVMARPQSVYSLQKVLNGELLDLVDPMWFETPAAWHPD